MAESVTALVLCGENAFVAVLAARLSPYESVTLLHSSWPASENAALFARRILQRAPAMHVDVQQDGNLGDAALAAFDHVDYTGGTKRMAAQVRARVGAGTMVTYIDGWSGRYRVEGEAARPLEEVIGRRPFGLRDVVEASGLDAQEPAALPTVDQAQHAATLAKDGFEPRRVMHMAALLAHHLARDLTIDFRSFTLGQGQSPDFMMAVYKYRPLLIFESKKALTSTTRAQAGAFKNAFNATKLEVFRAGALASALGGDTAKTAVVTAVDETIDKPCGHPDPRNIHLLQAHAAQDHPTPSTPVVFGRAHLRSWLDGAWDAEHAGASLPKWLRT